MSFKSLFARIPEDQKIDVRDYDAPASNNGIYCGEKQDMSGPIYRSIKSMHVALIQSQASEIIVYVYGDRAPVR